MATDYSNTGGTGDRRAIITITCSSDLAYTGDPTKLLDGAFGSNFYFSDQAVSGKTIMFDFGSTASKVIDEFRLNQSGTCQHGSWSCQASNNSSTWTNIGSSFVLGGSTLAVSTAMSTNTSGYRFYRLLGVSGNATSGPYVYEFEFKIDDYVSTHSASNSGLFFCHG